MGIRPGRDGDAAAVAALWTEGYSGRGGAEGRQATYTESDYADSAHQGQLFVAERDGEVVGVIVFFPPGAATWEVGPDEAGLSRLVVSERAQGRGVGRALVELCTARARDAGAEAIVLWSRPFQRDAHRLYESLGYRRAPQRDSRETDGGRWVFTLSLAPSR